MTAHRLASQGCNPLPGRSGRVAIVVLGIFTLLSIAAAGVAVFFQMQERTLRLAREKELRLAKAENSQLQKDVSDVTAAKKQAEGDLVQAKGDLEKAVQELAEEHKTREELAKAVDQRQKEIDRLSKDLDQIRAERTQLNQRLAQLTEQHKTLETHLDEVENAKTELETKMTQLSQGQPTVELEKVVVTDAGAGSAAGPATGAVVGATAGPQGQVVVVNRDYDFVVMNLGKNQGLALGQEFNVIRDNQVLGRVRVEKIYDELSAAAILPQSKKDAIREGDLVRAAL